MQKRSGVVVWITGLPQSGKSTFAEALAGRLARAGRTALVLDGDAVRAAIVPAHGYDAPARDAFYASLTNLAGLLARQGHVVVVPATAHAARFRRRARETVGVPLFLVYLAADRQTAAERDQKGLYHAAASGAAPDLPDATYEPPGDAEVVGTGGHDEVALARATERVLELAGGAS